MKVYDQVFLKTKVWFKSKSKSLNLKLWWESFVFVNHIDSSAVVAVNLKKHLQIHVYFSLFWLDLMEMCLVTKLRICVLYWSNSYSDFFVLAIFKGNILPFKL